MWKLLRRLSLVLVSWLVCRSWLELGPSASAGAERAFVARCSFGQISIQANQPPSQWNMIRSTLALELESEPNDDLMIERTGLPGY